MIFTPKFTAEGTLQEYPRPQFQRNSYLSLHGTWEYAITPSPQPPARYDGTILVPYSPESSLSGVGRQLGPDEFLHYRRTFTLPEGFDRGRVLLNVGACDQVCKVYCNGREIGGHEGGYLPFTLELTDALVEGANELCFVVTDDAASPIYGRGKQQYHSGGIWYTATSGLWQSVWLESVPQIYLHDLKLRPDYESRTLTISCEADGGVISYAIYDGETLLAETDVPAVLLPRAGGRTVTVYRSENGERGKLLHTVQYDGPVYGEKVFCGSEELEGYVRDGAVYLYGAQHFVFDYGKKALDVFPGVVYVASDVKKLTFRSEGRVTVQADICIRARTDAFELELENVTLQGAGERHAAVSFDEGAEDTALILGLYGLYNAVLCGYNAEDGADGVGFAGTPVILAGAVL